ncbi:hypothetical protein FKM82_008131 [Ascaphus truei]
MSGLGLLLQLCQLTSLALSALLRPKNLQLISENFQHILTWEEENNNTLLSYNVDFTHLRKGKWISANDCSNTTHLFCDLTDYFTDIQGHYQARVKSFTENDTSPVSISKELVPILDTLLGPPIVNVTACNSCVKVNIHPPISHLKSEDKSTVSILQDTVYPTLEYTIRLEQPNKEPSSIEDLREYTSDENFSTVIKNLLPSTNYCVSVAASASSNVNSNEKPSALQCVITTSNNTEGFNVGYIIAYIIGGILLLIGIFVLLIGLDKAKYLSMKNNFLPEVLKTLTKSESTFHENKEFDYLGHIVPVEIIIKETVKDDNDESDEEYSGQDYARRKGCPDNTQCDSSAPLTCSSAASSSVESSGAECGSSAEGAIPKEQQPSLDNNESSAPNTTLVDLNTTSTLSYNGSGMFNVNLNSVSVGDPENLWTGFKKEVAPKEDQKSSSESTRGSGDPPGACEPGLFTNVLIVDVPGIPVTGECSSEEDVTTEDSDDSDSVENLVSEYTRRYILSR